MNEKECLEHGGHCWNNYSGNDVVDKFGNIMNDGFVKAVHYPDGVPQFRRCKHCGKAQRQINEWEDYEN